MILFWRAPANWLVRCSYLLTSILQGTRRAGKALLLLTGLWCVLLPRWTGSTIAGYVVDVVDHACGQSGLCDAGLAAYGEWKCSECASCSCDAACHQYHDCCADKVVAQPVIGTGPDIRPYVSCVAPFRDDRPILAVVSCPDNSSIDSNVIDKCNRPWFDDVPQATVVTDLETNLTFRNEFCARCHGVLGFTAWNNRVTCDFSPTLSSISSKADLWRHILNSTDCQVRAVPPEGAVARGCQPDAVSSCNVSGTWREFNRTTQQLCARLYGPVKYYHPDVLANGQNRWYNNVFCLMCNGITLAPRTFPFCKPDRKNIFETRPLSVLLDFRPGDDDNTHENKTECRLQKQIYDPFPGDCRDLQCSERRVWTGESCEPTFAVAQWLGYSFTVTLSLDGHPPIGGLPNITRGYVEMLREKLEEFSPFVLTPVTLTVRVFSPANDATSSPERFHSLLVDGRILSTSNQTSRGFERALREIGTRPWILNNNNSSNKLTNVIPTISSELVFTPKFVSCNESELPGVSGLIASIFDRQLVSDPIGETLGVSGCGGTCIEQMRFVNIRSILDCPFVEYNLSNSYFRIEIGSNTLLFGDKSLVIDSFDYRICQNRIWLCAHILDEIVQLKNGASAHDEPDDESFIGGLTLQTVAIVCATLSMVCLFLTFCVYCMLAKLRTLPGKNTMCLVGHLFLSQLVFLTGVGQTADPTSCQALGVLIHLLWLLAFAWMAVCAYHMHKVFSDLLASRHDKISERWALFRYVLATSVSATAIVLACLGYHLISSGGVISGYGGRSCFISDRMVIGVAFATPLGLVLLVNVFFFIKTIMSIRDLPDMKNVSHNCHRQHVQIYFRLSVLLGFTWILGLLNQCLDKPNIYIAYLFEILTGCQGVFIFIAFCCNRRTLRLLRERCAQTPPSRSSSETNHNTHSSSM